MALAPRSNNRPSGFVSRPLNQCEVVCNGHLYALVPITVIWKMLTLAEIWFVGKRPKNCISAAHIRCFRVMQRYIIVRPVSVWQGQHLWKDQRHG